MVSTNSAISRALAACSLFKGLKGAEIESLAELCEIRHVEKGKQIFSEGDLAQAFYVLASGRVRIFKLAASGREQTLITPEPPMSFAEAALFADQRYPAYCTALEDSDIGRAITRIRPENRTAISYGRGPSLGRVPASTIRWQTMNSR